MKRPPRPSCRLLRVTTLALMTSALLVPTTAHASGGGGTEDEDVVPPVVTVAPLPDAGWHSSPTTYRIRAIDEGPLATGVSFVNYRLSGATTATGKLDRITGGELTVSNDGITRIEVEAVDGNGNPGYADFEVRVDRTAPVVTFTSPQPGPTPVTIPLGGQTRLHYTCSDPGATSGIASCSGDVATGGVLPAGATGEFTAKVTARDNAGNVAVGQFTYRVSSAISTITRPAVAGTPRLGSLLTGTPGTYSPEPDTTACRWQRDGADIAGASTSTYAVIRGDLGHQLTYRCTLTRAGFPELSVTSLPLSVPLEPMPKVLENVRVSGTGRVGETLTGAYDLPQIPVASTSLTRTLYWTRDGVQIPGATGTTYVVLPADHGHQISAFARAEWEGYVTTDYPAAQAIPITGLRSFDVSGAPAVRGTPAVGQTLAAALPEVRPHGPAPVTPFATTTTWLRDGQPIADASGTTYLLRAVDSGHRISVRFAAAGAGYETATLTSASTATIDAGQPGAQATSRITARAKALGHRAVRLNVRVSAGQSPATGEVVIRRGRKVVGHGVLANGRVVISLRKQEPGVARYRVTYPGSPNVAAARTRVRIRVR